MRILKLQMNKFTLTTPLKIWKINPEFKSLKSLIIQLPDLLLSTGETIYKDRNELKILTTGYGKVIIKSFGKIYLANRFIYAWIRPSKAKRSFENALLLQKKEINTPTPIAYIECFKKGLIGKNMYVYMYEHSTDNMRKVLADKNYPGREKLLHDFTGFTFSLYQKGVYHKDYSPGNILFKKKETEYHFSLVDINRVKFGPLAAEKKYMIFRRLLAGKDTLQVIAKAYAGFCQEDEKLVYEKILFYSQKFSRKRSRKKAVKKYLKKS